MAEQKDFFSIPEAAGILGVSRIAVFKKVKKGQLAAIRIGRNWAVPASALKPVPGFPPVSISPPPVDKIRVSARIPVQEPSLAEEPVDKSGSMDEMGWD